MPSRPLRLLRSLALLLSLLLLYACQSTPAKTAAAVPPLFLDLSFADACSRAATENKNILLFFDGDWSDQSQPLLTKIFPHRDVAALVRSRTIPLHLDVIASGELTKRYHVRDIPLILLIAPDGREIDRWDGFDDAADCKRELTAALAGESSVHRLRAKIKPDDLKDRLKLGRQLITQGNYDAAVAELSSLYTHPKLKTFGHIWDPSKTKIIQILGGIRKEFPAASSTLTSWRAENESAVQTNPRNWQAASLVLTLDRALKDDDHALAFFNQLPPGSSARNHLKRDIFKILASRRAYTEAAALLTTGEAVAALQSERYLPALARGIIRIIIPFSAGRAIKAAHLGTLKNRLAYFEVYAAARDLPTARHLAKVILDEDKSGRAVEALTASVKKVRPADTELFLASLGIPALQTSFLPAP